MKKIISIIIICISLLFLTGCYGDINTPTGAVEDYLLKFQNLDNNVLLELDDILKSDNTLSGEEKEDYRTLMLNQYRNLTFKIIDEVTIKDEAEVNVEIEVLDYASSVGEAKLFYKNNPDEFKDNSFNSYKIKKMREVVDTKKEDITFYLTKIDNSWVIDDLSERDILKIHGLYEG